MLKTSSGVEVDQAAIVKGKDGEGQAQLWWEDGKASLTIIIVFLNWSFVAPEVSKTSDF